MRVIALARLNPSVGTRLVGFADLIDQMLAELVLGADSRLRQSHRDCEGARLPRRTEGPGGVDPGIGEQFGKRQGRPHDRANALCEGGAITAVPIIESRVTKAASSCSLIAAVPAGRRGITM